MIYLKKLLQYTRESSKEKKLKNQENLMKVELRICCKQISKKQKVQLLLITSVRHINNNVISRAIQCSFRNSHREVYLKKNVSKNFCIHTRVSFLIKLHAEDL